jgi:hypothetical protein
MNAGMRDVINLAWKLPLILAGQSKPQLLHTYQAERAAHAADLVEWAVALGRLMENLAAAEAAERAGSAAPDLPAASRSSGYGQGRESPPLRDGVIMLEQVSDTGSTGYLFSQPQVRDNADPGRPPFLLDTLLGQGFAIVTRDDGDLPLNTASQALIERLNIPVVSLQGLSLVRGHFDRLFDHAGTAVVRPDRYVFGHTSNDIDINALLAALADRLYLT